jgi:hypothetical protein
LVVLEHLILLDYLLQVEPTQRQQQLSQRQTRRLYRGQLTLLQKVVLAEADRVQPAAAVQEL